MRKSSKIFISVVLALAIVVAILAMFLFIPLKGTKHNEIWSYEQNFDISDIQTLEKTPDKDFLILQLTDVQLWSLLGDNKKALELCSKAINDIKPDLIVLTGDNVSGITTNLLVKQLIKAMDSFNIPWAPVFGNHDSEGKATLNWQGDRFIESKNCLFKKGPTNLYGLGNYVVNIKESGKIVQTLFFLDNGRYIKYPNGEKKEVYISYAQQAWYKWNIMGIKKETGKIVPSMTFSHFAISEAKTAIEKLAIKGSDDRYYVPEEYGFGSCSYLPGVPLVNSGFFSLAKELKSTHSMFFGHDHENDASVVYEGIRLTYGLKAGISPRPWNNATEYGGTVIRIKSKNSVIGKNYTVTVEHKAYEKA